MTTSGSTSFSVTRDDVIRAAFRTMGVIGLGEQPSAEEMSNAAMNLNMLMKYWQSKGMNRWTETEAIMFPALGVPTFFLGAGAKTAAKCCNSADLITTSLTAITLLGGSTVTVADATGLVSGQNIGIVESATSIFWTTINGAPAGNVVTLAAVAPFKLDTGSPVYVYTTGITRPVKISECRRRINPGGLDTPLLLNTRSDYTSLPLKLTTGLPNQIFYDPQLGQGQMSIWPTNNDARNMLVFTYNRSIQDFLSALNTPDYPQEWYRALVYGLANDMCSAYGITGDAKRDIQLEAVQSFNDLSGFDTDIALYIQPAIRSHGV